MTKGKKILLKSLLREYKQSLKQSQQFTNYFNVIGGYKNFIENNSEKYILKKISKRWLEHKRQK